MNQCWFSRGLQTLGASGGPGAALCSALETGYVILSVAMFLEPLETLFWSSRECSRGPGLCFSYLLSQQMQWVLDKHVLKGVG